MARCCSVVLRSARGGGSDCSGGGVRSRITVTTEIELSIEKAAEWFCGLTDDDQAKFFVAVAELANNWPRPAAFQWAYVGGHLRNCECSTEDARDMIRAIYHNMETA